MHGPINVKSPNNISEWQMGFNSAFKGLMTYPVYTHIKSKYSKPSPFEFSMFLKKKNYR